MSSHELLQLLLGVELAVALLATALLIGRRAWRRFRAVLLRERVEQTRRLLLTRLLDGPDGHHDPAPWLPVEETVQVVESVLGPIAGTERRHFALAPVERRLLRAALRWCRAWRWTRRLAGVRLLTLLGGDHPAAEARLDDRRADVRAEAASWAAGQPSLARIGRLLEMLDDESTACRLMARAALVRIGEPAREPLLERLDGAGARPLEASLRTACHFAHPSLQEPALRAARHDDAAVRRAAVALLGALGGEPSVQALEVALFDEDVNVRAEATAALGGLGHWASAPRIAERLRDPGWIVRRAAGLALRALGAPGGLYLRRALRDEDPFAVDMAQQVLDLPSGPERRRAAG